MNGLRKYTYTQWNFTQAKRRMKFLLFSGKWMELENIILSEVSQAQKVKAACSPSYADCRPKTNAAILWDTDHIH
jgi:hypothetical protein